MGWQDARDSWGIRTGGGWGSEGLWRRRDTEELGCAAEGGPQRQVGWSGLGIQVYFPICFKVSTKIWRRLLNNKLQNADWVLGKTHLSLHGGQRF